MGRCYGGFAGDVQVELALLSKAVRRIARCVRRHRDSVIMGYWWCWWESLGWWLPPAPSLRQIGIPETLRADGKGVTKKS